MDATATVAMELTTAMAKGLVGRRVVVEMTAIVSFVCVLCDHCTKPAERLVGRVGGKHGHLSGATLPCARHCSK